MQEMIADVRRFNRTVTAQVGALDDQYLGRDRPLGEARLLWEIGDGTDLRALRERLRLDSGYLSRLLAKLGDLVEVEASPDDRRVRHVRLTAKGLEERRLLDARSDELAASFLVPLSETQRENLVVAMRTVERLLTAGLVEVRQVQPGHPDAQRCISAYFADLDARAPFDPGANDIGPVHQQLVAYLHGEPVGCGALKHHDGWSEIKRLWVDQRTRGLGLGRRLLLELEARAFTHGSDRVRLDTNHHLHEAIALYRGHGYTEIPPFNDEPYAHYWFEKHLTLQ